MYFIEFFKNKLSQPDILKYNPDIMQCNEILHDKLPIHKAQLLPSKNVSQKSVTVFPTRGNHTY